MGDALQHEINGGTLLEHPGDGDEIGYPALDRFPLRTIRLNKPNLREGRRCGRIERFELAQKVQEWIERMHGSNRHQVRALLRIVEIAVPLRHFIQYAGHPKQSGPSNAAKRTGIDDFLGFLDAGVEPGLQTNSGLDALLLR